MAQQSITTFFAVNKRKSSPGRPPPDAKRRETPDSSSEVRCATPERATPPNAAKTRRAAKPRRASAGDASPVASDAPASPDASDLLEETTTAATDVPQSANTLTREQIHERLYAHLVGAKRAAPGAGRRAMKPYDEQYIALKEQHLDAVLLVQNGYKYQVLGEDAYGIGPLLGRSPVAGWRSLHDEGDPTDALYDRFASLTFPVDRLPFYVEKLVSNGLKVAVAKQLETPALKSQSANKRGPFRREVTNVYTQGTLVEELTAGSSVAGPVLALTPTKTGFALLGVQPATGAGVWDEFEDGGAFSELETRLLHLAPSEIVVVSDLGAAANMVRSMGIRLVETAAAETEKDEKEKLDLSAFARPDDSETAPDAEAEANTEAEAKKDSVPKVVSTPALRACYDALRVYLREFGLESTLRLDFDAFAQGGMRLGADALTALDIFTCDDAGTPTTHGSLLWALDATQTPFGRRQLRRWLGRPLLDRDALAERVEAVEEVLAAEQGSTSASTVLATLKKQLVKVPDLERYAVQVFHGRIAPKQLYWFLYHFVGLLTSVTTPQIEAAKLHSPLLRRCLASLEPTRAWLEPLFTQISGIAAKGTPTFNSYSRGFVPTTSDLPNYFTASSDLAELVPLRELDAEIAEVRADFAAFLAEEESRLRLGLREVHAAGEEDTFVIGVPKSKSAGVPTSWRRQGAVSAETRFWAPFSLEQTKKLRPLLERQAAAAQAAFDAFVARLGARFEDLRRCVADLATLDCLFSHAAVSSRPDYVKPDIIDNPCLEIDSGRHPVLEQLDTTVVPNSIAMHEAQNRVMVVTGANMGGKSSYVRQTALLVIMAQVGCYVPAARMRLSLVDAVYARMGAFDNLLRGESTFYVELKECAAILAQATPRSLVLLDEIGRGTSTADGVAIASAVLHHLVWERRAFTLFITHYPLLAEQAAQTGSVAQNWSMDVAENDDEVTFLYRAVPRPASSSYGINVARLAGLPEPVLAAAAVKSREFELETAERREAARRLAEVSAYLQGEGDIEAMAEEEQEFVPETQEA